VNKNLTKEKHTTPRKRKRRLPVIAVGIIINAALKNSVEKKISEAAFILDSAISDPSRKDAASIKNKKIPIKGEYRFKFGLFSKSAISPPKAHKTATDIRPDTTKKIYACTINVAFLSFSGTK
jgi:hypothetical protein